MAASQNPALTPDPNWADAVLTFWFEELTFDDWFTGGARVDDLVRSRFSGLYDAIAGELPEGALDDPRTALAAIILFDQFFRNLFRGAARAFAADDLALAIAGNAVDRGWDESMSSDERLFLYLPFEHSEMLADGERSVSLFTTLGHEKGLAAAIEHRDILERFGRYPHRNKALGRESTAQEAAFLASHKGFGQ